MIAIVCGDREWCYRSAIEHALSSLMYERKLSEVVVGGCRGADRIVAAVARVLGMKVVEMPADWARYSKTAGPIRNRKMLAYLMTAADPDRAVVAFHDRLEASKGTADMVRAAQDADVEVLLFRSDGSRTVLGSPRTGGS